MKIGIITFWDSDDNYGQQLQCFALQQYLREQGHEPFLIRYRPTPPPASRIKLTKLFTYIAHFRQYFNFYLDKKRTQKYENQNGVGQRDFEKFRRENLLMTQAVYDSQMLMENPPEADAYICGSDQIWGGDLMYYMPFVPQSKLKISFAPSFGGTNPFATVNAKEIKRLLNEYKFISVREKSGAELLHKQGFVNAVQVPDPTLLPSIDVYDSIAQETIPGKRAFIYLLGNRLCCGVEDIIEYINKKGMECTYVASQGQIDRFPKQHLSIGEWINSIKKAELVITNSFHCVVFSLLYHRPFIFIPLAGSFARMNDRLYDILGKCGLENRIYNGNFENIPLTIDFMKFDNYRNNEQLKVNHLFKSILS